MYVCLSHTKTKFNNHFYMKKIFYLLLLIVLIGFTTQAEEIESPIRIACVGNSITYGSSISNRDKDSYPAVLGQMLGERYDVRNFGFSGRVLLQDGDFPYMKEYMFQDALNFNPNIVIIKLGTNDSKPQNWIHGKKFAKDMQTMINKFKALEAKPKIYVCYPAKAYKIKYGINDSIIYNEIIPIIKKTAAKNKLEIIDIHSATDNMPERFGDGIHPDVQGTHHMATTIYKAITGKESNHKTQAFPGKISQWENCDRYDFKFKGRKAIVVTPKKAAKGKPWIWRPAFFGAFASVDKALLKEGFHIVYYDITHLYGSPNAVYYGNEFYKNMITHYGLSEKVTLEGFSRGGLFAFNWAAQNPEKVACIYVDAPVCDVFVWPSRERVDLWNDMLKIWELSENDMKNFKGNPIDNLAPIAAAGIPIIAVCGDSDQTVPYEKNMKIVRDRYAAMGAPVEVILKKGCDHHPHSLENPEPIVDFILRHQSEYKKYLHYNIRGSLQNSLHKFEKERKARIAFLGGSITEMDGWHNMIEQQLKQRFPYTEFEWVEAGISSTGTTPGAFRLQNDILSKGKIDLLFVEAAVNDDTNKFNATEQIRGMEGIIRHALKSNPEMDIVMLHFIYDPFIPQIAKKQQPDVILNHERVANHYLIPSINLCQEIAERMQDGEFNWDTFGGTHPKPFGHKFYAAAIGHLFDQMWQGLSFETPCKPHEIPTEPLDSFCYENGDFLSIHQARINKGWKIVENWRPDNNIEKRKGFVDVPMLEATQPGDQLTLNFKGKAIGIFCLCGPSCGIIEYSIDGKPFKEIDMFTNWSRILYLPWVYMLETELENKEHKLVLRMSKKHNPKSKGYECQIRNFVINQ